MNECGSHPRLRCGTGRRLSPLCTPARSANGISGWVWNQQHGVEVHAEGSNHALETFIEALKRDAPEAAKIRRVEVCDTAAAGLASFVIRESASRGSPTAHISPDLPVCDECLAELFDPANPRYLYPYINCTDCGPRFTVIQSLPYDRERTTMRQWTMDALCAGQYRDASDRRFHAQPIACPACGPHYVLQYPESVLPGDDVAIREAPGKLREGHILGVKGIGGYHLSCDAQNAASVCVA